LIKPASLVLVNLSKVDDADGISVAGFARLITSAFRWRGGVAILRDAPTDGDEVRNLRESLD
jgi:hypothetical protein